MSIIGDCISDSLFDIGMLGIGQSPSPEQLAQGLRYTNRMLSRWSAQRLMLPSVPSTPYVLTANLQDYVLGPSAAGPGSFVTPRPTFIQSAQVKLPGSAMTEPLNLLDATKWAAIRDKGATCSANGLPQDIWIEYATPNIFFHLWTIPSNAATIMLAAWGALQQFVTIFDTITLPPEYESALQRNLSVELAGAYDMPVPPEVAALAADTLIQIQKLNAQSLGGQQLGESALLTTPNQVLPPPIGGGGPGGQ